MAPLFWLLYKCQTVAGSAALTLCITAFQSTFAFGYFTNAHGKEFSVINSGDAFNRKILKYTGETFSIDLIWILFPPQNCLCSQLLYGNTCCKHLSLNPYTMGYHVFPNTNLKVKLIWTLMTKSLFSTVQNVLYILSDSALSLFLADRNSLLNISEENKCTQSKCGFLLGPLLGCVWFFSKSSLTGNHTHSIIFQVLSDSHIQHVFFPMSAADLSNSHLLLHEQACSVINKCSCICVWGGVCVGGRGESSV